MNTEKQYFIFSKFSLLYPPLKLGNTSINKFSFLWIMDQNYSKITWKYFFYIIINSQSKLATIVADRTSPSNIAFSPMH